MNIFSATYFRVFLSVLFTLSGSIAAASEVSPISLASSEHFEPYVFYEDDRAVKGIDFELVQKIFNEIGLPFVIYGYPRKRITMMLENQTLDGLATTTSYAELATLEKMWLSEPLYHSEVSAFALEGSNYRVGLLENENSMIGVPHEFENTYKNVGEKYASHAIKVQRDRQLVDLLMAKRIKYAISEDISFIYQARKHGVFQQIKVVEEITSRPVYLALSKSTLEQHAGLDKKINQQIKQLREKGFIDELIVRYLQIDQR